MTLELSLQRIVARGLARHAVNRMFRRLVRNVNSATISKLSGKSYEELSHADTKTPLGRKVVPKYNAKPPVALFDFSTLHSADRAALKQYIRDLHEHTALDSFFYLAHGNKLTFSKGYSGDEYRKVEFRSMPTVIKRDVNNINRLSLKNMLQSGPASYNNNVDLRVVLEDKRNGFANLRPKLEALTAGEREILSHMVDVNIPKVGEAISDKTVKQVGRRLVSFAKSVKDHEVMHSIYEIAHGNAYDYESSLLSEGPSHAVEAMGKNEDILKWRTEKRLEKYAQPTIRSLANDFDAPKIDPKIKDAFREYIAKVTALSTGLNAQGRAKLAAVLSDTHIRTLRDGIQIVDFLKVNLHLLKAPTSRFYSDKLKTLKEEVKERKVV